MKKTAPKTKMPLPLGWAMALYIFLLPIMGIAQVGVGTQDPQATLHIADADSLQYGLRIDKVPYQSSNKVLTLSANNEVGYANIATGEVPTFQIYEAIVQEVKYWRPQNAGTVQYHWEDLGLSLDINISPNKTAIIELHYYIPIGTSMFNYKPRGYFGATLYKNGTELYPSHSKTAMSKIYNSYDDGNGGHNAYMLSFVENSYFESITNPTSSPMTVTYKLLAYVEHIFAERPTGPTYIIGAFSMGNGSSNVNWGKARLTIKKTEF